MADTKDESKRTTFLHEAQQEGKASGDVLKMDLDQAITEITHIMNDDVIDAYRSKNEDEWPTTKMAIYCHDCRTIVPAGIGKSLRGNPRTVCGTCGSKKISMGREDALQSFYQLDENNLKKQKHPPREKKEDKRPPRKKHH